MRCPGLLFFAVALALTSSPLLAQESACAPVDYKNGVYYFPCVGTNFAEALSAFKEANPTLSVEAMTGNGTGTHGHDTGYFVSVENR